MDHSFSYLQLIINRNPFQSSRGILLIACLACWLIQDSLSALEEQPLQLLPNGGFSFGFANRDRGAAFHEARGTPDKVVRGRFGSRSPANGRIEETVYTAGPRGYVSYEFSSGNLFWY